MSDDNMYTNNEMVTVKNASGKRRGRKSQQIFKAFDAVTEEPVLLSEHAAKFGISEKVLRQAKRFEELYVSLQGRGRIRVTQHAYKNGDRSDKNLYIYREKNSSKSGE